VRQSSVTEEVLYLTHAQEIKQVACFSALSATQGYVTIQRLTLRPARMPISYLFLALAALFVGHHALSLTGYPYSEPEKAGVLP
jgi:hypothetical protein